jgi:preprotein translocase subunit SecY
MLQNIINTFRNCFKIPELKSRIVFTVVVLAICRVVAMIPIPGLDGTALAEFFKRNASKEGGGLLGIQHVYRRCAGALCRRRPRHHALHQRHHYPATLDGRVTQLSKLAREEGGRAKIIQYGRYLTVLLCLGQGLFMAIGWENASSVFPASSANLCGMTTSGGIESKPSSSSPRARSS